MARLASLRHHKKSPKIEIIPMVDVMFLLLVFYILSSLALHRQQGIPVALPSAASGESAQVEELTITITSKGEYFFNKQPSRLEELGGQVKSWGDHVKGGLSQASVVLNADAKAEHRAVVNAMDELRKAGVSNFVISTGGPRG